MQKSMAQTASSHIKSHLYLQILRMKPAYVSTALVHCSCQGSGSSSGSGNGNGSAL